MADTIEYMLQTESVIKQYKQYDTVITAVNRVSIKVEPGEFVAIIGTSGSGKSTFLHICAGLDSADAGRVLIRGQDITKMSADELSRFRGMNMGFIFQRHNLIPQFTALENILIPTMMCNKSELSYQETLRRLVETLQLTERLNHLPSELSGGQLQLAFVARALAGQPKVLILDEPESHLDFKNQYLVLDLIEKLVREKGISCIMNTHFPEHALQLSDLTLMMGKNKFSFGETEEVLTEENVEEFFGVRARILDLGAENQHKKAFVIMGSLE